MIELLSVPVTERDHVRGAGSARVVLVEYGDFGCPFCQAAYPVLKRLLERFGRDAKLVFRHNPRGELHVGSRLAAHAAEAASLQGQFWAMHDRLFEEQRALDDAVVAQQAASLGLDPELFATDLRSRAVALRVRDDEVGGLRSGVVGTPTFFVDGKHYRDKPDLESLSRAVERALGEPTQPAAH